HPRSAPPPPPTTPPCRRPSPSLFFSPSPPPPNPPLFPYTTLFRSCRAQSPDQGPSRAPWCGCVRTAERCALDPRRRYLARGRSRSEEHTSELQSLTNLVCRLLLQNQNAAASPSTSAARARLPHTQT